MLINGEKFACEACVRGHRVSSCHHQEPHTCCCQHGQRCTCSLKKELDPVLEDTPQLIQPKEHHKPRPNMNSHEPKPTIFTNGHHKPVHKFNDAHNQLGTPYKIPSRSNSLHGHREMAHRSTDSLPLQKSSKPFHESPLHNSMTEAMSIMQRQVKSEHNSPSLGPTRLANVDPSIQDLAIPSFDPNAYSYSPFATETPPTQANSLQSSQNTSQQDLTLPERFPESWFMTYEQAHDYEPPPGSRYTDFSAVDWSTFNLDPNTQAYNNSSQSNSPYLAQQQQPQFQPFDLSSRINNVGITPSSGDVSEVDDQSPPSHLPMSAQPLRRDFNTLAGDDLSDPQRLSSASSYYGTPQASMLASDNLGALDIDEYIKQAEAETKRMQMQQQLAQMQMSQHQPQDAQSSSRLSSVSRGITPSVSTPGSTTALNGEHPYTIREAQRYAHMDSLSNMSLIDTKPNLPQPVAMVDDPAWSVAPDMSNPELSLDDAQEAEDWVR
ncbi:hypothetical protein HRR78_006683 [Exophiala dermatitidis]|nr:hypothetical protein HRR75_004316 [Exophiala dermatitidis]KAJ4542949.1 hypothetical protein HRR78_006683 [Exophiala dermatitidis]